MTWESGLMDAPATEEESFSPFAPEAGSESHEASEDEGPPIAATLDEEESGESYSVHDEDLEELLSPRPEPDWEGEPPYVQEEGSFEEEASTPATLRDRAVAIARQELARWGRGAKKETQSDMRGTLQTYWENILSPREAQVAIDKRDPWSAAFISWVWRQAGAGSSFAYSAAHRVYAAAAKKARKADDRTKFWAFGIAEAVPEVGDLVFRDRQGAKGSCAGTTLENVDDGTMRATHSDIVVAVRPREIDVIGGNVSDSVSLKTIPLDANGRVAQPSSCKYFAIAKPPGAAVKAPATPAATAPSHAASKPAAPKPAAPAPASSSREAAAFPRLVLIRNTNEPEFQQRTCSRDGNASRLNPKLKYSCSDGVQMYYSPDAQANRPVAGYRSTLRVELEPGVYRDFYAIERANGFRHLEPREYIATMGARIGKEGNQEIIVHGNVVIHVGNTPAMLEGCIAPGRVRTPNGVREGSEALAEINRALGGWVAGKRVRVLVQGSHVKRG